MTVAFGVLSGVIIIFALAMVLSKNLVHSAIYMVVTFLGVAGIYLTLSADFLAAVQVLVYVGAISILLVFGVMLTPRGDIKESNLYSKHKWGSILVSLGLFIILGRLIFTSFWPVSNGSVPESTVGPIAELMMNVYVIPFETAALLLLAALVGAIIVGKGARQNR
ncbi:NADH-quinone oxidoreductase subunit J family protein [Dehalobacterium formicoaceticum]|uniref:NADH-quinone oxidoreductase subunit J n=1 Tax=Dehalobacterium formicoaceticum TaxID=51515 RepID=A0ABT1Y826_9FIRM|nr:NADH-quinone oxidoreductase subunit J [Dehalobacterium formicoaceticum]MCR6546235.1 NADH-quinone oxidoreductase subunit J [Dehalobacterium formicoaceticum]